MKFFLDSAKIEEIRQAKELPFFAGVTTNPILLEKAKITNRERFYESVLSLIQKKELFVQVFSDDEDNAYKEGISLSGMARDRIVVKIPATNALLKAAVRLTEKGVRVCLTAISNIRQIAISCTLGIEYCAVYLNRMIEQKKDIYHHIMQSDKMIENNGFRTRILVASLPKPSLIEPLLSLKNLDYTLPFLPFVNLSLTEESAKWIRGFYEVTNKNSRKR
ncbi:MAG: hypothetical protein N2746_01355 [Deltaproteobacteria bacterium]|nr:hypothetical protein [Deltaproteobacteria bacterium]